MHRGGYDAFSFDITEALKAQGAQELIVEVFDPTNDGGQPRGKQTLNPEASCTRRPPASGRRCGWNRCRRRTSKR